jgi:protein gp37
MTTISWTDETWNPTRGCRRVSPGCEHCYAERQAIRMSNAGGAYEGLVKLTKNGPRWTGKGRLVVEQLTKPLSWRAPRRIFVDSMSDLFFEASSNEEIAAVFGVMAAAPRHTFQILTKRPQRMREWFAWIEKEAHKTALAASGGKGGGFADAENVWWRALVCLEHAGAALGDIPAGGGKATWPLSNVWLGVSVEDQPRADERIPELLATPAAVRFLSCEPLLGAIDLQHVQNVERTFEIDALAGTHGVLRPHSGRCARIDWVILGCESGPGARPCELAWLRSLRDQCEASGTAFFLKQAVRQRSFAVDYEMNGVCHPVEIGTGAREKGGNVIELPYLDGVQHAAFPTVRS